MTVYDLFLDLTFASLLILIGQLMRAKIPFFQKYFMPASMIAGFLGLILGPGVLNIIPFSGEIGSYTGILIIFIFTIVGINGFEFSKTSGKQELQRIIGFQLYRIIAVLVQFLIPILFTVFIFQRIWPELNDGFGMLLVTGFYGGHGTATAVGDAFVELGWADARDLATTFATIGILTGVFVGLALIKSAAKKQETAYIKDYKNIHGDLRTGLISKENRKSIGEETISPVSLDTLAFHLSLILTVSGLSYLISQFISVNLVAGIPAFTISYIVALIFFILFKKSSLYNYIDTGINNKISGTSTDYLVFFGIAAIKLEVVAKYAGPLIAMTLLGIFIVVMMLKLGKGFNKDSWFERSIFIFGYSTGVFAIGFVLLRIVDPNAHSMTVEDTALTPITSFLEIALWGAVPALLMSGQWMWIAGVMAIGVVACAIAAKLTGTWVYNVPKSKRIALGTNEPYL